MSARAIVACALFVMPAVTWSPIGAATPARAQTRKPASLAPAVDPTGRGEAVVAPGQDPAPVRQSAPIAVGTTLRIQRLGLGQAATCGLVTDGTVRCWGTNYASVPLTRSEAPWTVPDLSDVASIAVGRMSGCAIRSTGAVRCWGVPSYGRLGYPEGSPPADVAGLNGVRDLAVGDSGACALDPVGSVWCWGSNSTGQLGGGTLTPSQTSTPMRVVALAEVRRIAAGAATFCAIANSSGVWCWGDGSQGQLGPGVASSTVPVPIVGLDGALDVSIGDSHICAVRANGHVQCWGGNDSGELGDATQVSRPTPADAIGITTATNVSAGSGTTCALLSDASASCWGTNRWGQLGIGTHGSRLVPAPVASAGLTEIHVGRSDAPGNHTCALRSDGRVLCWGSDSAGRLGTFTPQFVAAPAPVEGLTGAVRVYGDASTVCAQTNTGTVACWGAYPGDGPGLAARPSTVSNLSNPSFIDGGRFHACASTATAGVSCWGSGSMGQFGNGSLAFAATPTATGFSSNVLKVVVLLGHTCPLFISGTVQCVGGFLPNTQGPITTIIDGGAIDIDGSTNQACLITAARTVRCWQAGTTNLVVQAGVSGAVELAVGRSHACARITDGSVRCWGADTSGQHGDGSRSTTIGVGVETTSVDGLADAIAIAAGPDHTCAVRANGHAVCWGSNASRQLGFEPTLSGFSFSERPVEVPTIMDATGLAAGGDDTTGDWSCVRRSAASVACWGAAGGGALGRSDVGFLDRPGVGPTLART